MPPREALYERLFFVKDFAKCRQVLQNWRFLRGRSLKGRRNICVYAPLCACVSLPPTLPVLCAAFVREANSKHTQVCTAPFEWVDMTQIKHTQICTLTATQEQHRNNTHPDLYPCTGDDHPLDPLKPGCANLGGFPVLPFLGFSVLPRKNLKLTKVFFLCQTH